MATPNQQRRLDSRVVEMFQKGDDPETRALAAATGRTARICGTINAWLARHPHNCRCRVCKHMRRHNPQFRDQIAALAYNLRALADMTDADRPATTAELLDMHERWRAGAI